MKGTKMSVMAAAVLAALAMIAGGCNNSSDGVDWLASYLVVANTDYVAANAAAVNLDDEGGTVLGQERPGFAVRESQPGLDTDVTYVETFSQDGYRRAYVIGRTESMIYGFDPSQGMGVLDSFSVGASGWAGENPQDMLVLAKHKAYVSRYGSDDVLIVDPTDGSRLGNITFVGAATNSDGLARPADMIKAGGKVFLALQNLDSGFNYCTASIENGMIAVIDPATDTVETIVTLHTADPYRLYFSKARGQVVVASPGHFAVDSAGCAIYDPDFDASRGGLELLEITAPYRVTLLTAGDDAAVNGTIFDVTGAGPDRAYILVSDGFKNYGMNDRMLEVNLDSGAVNGAFRYPATPTGADDLSGLASYDGMVVTGDRIGNQVAIFVYGSDTPLATVGLSLPPMGMAVLKP